MSITGNHGVSKLAWAEQIAMLFQHLSLSLFHVVIDGTNCSLEKLYNSFKAMCGGTIVLHNICHAPQHFKTELNLILAMKLDVICICTGNPEKMRDFLNHPDTVKLKNHLHWNVSLRPFSVETIFQIVIKVLELTSFEWTISKFGNVNNK